MNIPKAYASIARKNRLDLCLSTNPLGCSSRALSAIRTIDKRTLSQYPDTSRLTQKLSSRYGIPKDGIVLGDGSEQLIKVISQAFLQPLSRVMVERSSFSLFSAEPLLIKATVTYVGFDERPPVSKRPDLLFLANPTTPGGVDRPIPALLSLIDRIRARVTVVDEANGELGASSLVPSITKLKSVIVLRTFSKTLGLAGLRVGYALTNPALADTLRLFQQPFPVSAPALVAASETLSDREFLRRSVRFIRQESAFLKDALRVRCFSVSDSVTNNIYVSREDSPAVIRELDRLGVSVIDGKYFPGNTVPGFRISLRDKKTNRLFIKKLDTALSCLKGANLLPSKEVL